MIEYFQKYHDSQNVVLEEKENHLSVQIIHLPNYRFVFTIPFDVFEWYVSLYDYNSNEELWSDWSEWYKSGEITAKNISQYYEMDIKCYFEKILSASDFRIINEAVFRIFKREFFKRKKLLAKINNDWIEMNVGDVPDNNYIMDNSHWKVNGIKDLDLFFNALHSLADTDMVLCLSEGAWSSQTISRLEEISKNEMSYPVKLSEFKKSYFITVNNSNISFLSQLAHTSAETEIALHIAVVWKSQRILEWFDIPGDQISISNLIPEERVKLFVEKCFGNYIFIENGV